VWASPWGCQRRTGQERTSDEEAVELAVGAVGAIGAVRAVRAVRAAERGGDR
jgi:hypothetical protein